jgi:sugar phosphate isomerase/epimerase
MFDLAISEMTTSRWDLAVEVSRLVEHGYDAIAAWRPKVSDLGVAAAASLVASAGLRVSSVQWAGGFTGGDGRSFDEGIDDACDAIDMAEGLAAGVVVLHSGCRGGHTRSHATRLLWQALELLAPRAARAGVVLALRPLHPAAAGCSFFPGLAEAIELIERFDDPAVGLAFDLWHWADDPRLGQLLPRLAEAAAIVQVADRFGPLVAGGDRLPPGQGCLPLEATLADLVEAGFQGDVEFDPVGEAVELQGYDAVLAETRHLAAAWSGRLAADLSQPVELPRPHVRRDHFRGAGARRSQASSQTVSPG